MKERADKSARIEARVLASTQYARSRALALYSPIRGEVATEAIARAALTAGKRVAYPRVAGDAGRMIFHWIDAVDALAPGRHGILEPDGGRPEAPVSAMDLIVVPGLGFDPEGGRLGWGAGYYDRVLARRGARAVTIGLAYESQILPALPRDAHDVAMDVVATEARWMERRPEPGAGNPEDPGTSE